MVEYTRNRSSTAEAASFGQLRLADAAALGTGLDFLKKQ
jgi:hypothetical protein